MKKELIKKNGNILSIGTEGEPTSLRDAVGILAISTYEEYVECCEECDEEKKKRLKEKIVFQSNLLKSLSNALMAITKKDFS